MFVNFLLLNDLDGALDVSLPMYSNPDLAKTALPEHLTNFVPVLNVFNFLESSEILKSLNE
jgi:hypothetical protein